MAWRRYYIVVEVPEEALRDEDRWSDVVGAVWLLLEEVARAGGHSQMTMARVREPLLTPVDPSEAWEHLPDDDEELEVEVLEGDGRDA